MGERKRSLAAAKLAGDDEPPLTVEAATWRRNRAREKLFEKLSLAPGFDFLVMVWAANAIDTGRLKEGLAEFERPDPDLVKRLQEVRFFFHPWTLETLVNEWLMIEQPPLPRTARRVKMLNVKKLGTAVDLMNLQNNYENAEDGIVLLRVSVLLEMSRLAQREFPWQRRKVTVAALYRAARLYMFPLADEYFRSQVGIRMADFCKVCFVLYAHFMQHSWLRANETMIRVGITSAVRDSVYRRVVASFDEAASLARSLRPPSAHPSYAASALRPKPVLITPDGRLLAPLVDLVMERCTSGLFYDLVGAGGEVRRKIGENFEGYCRDLLAGYLRTVEVRPSAKYRVGKSEVETPDALIVRKNEVSLIVECKARRAPFEDKFGEGKEALDEGASDELVKAVVQIWRFASHRRQGRVDTPVVADDAIGLVLTLDNWMEFAEKQKAGIVARALAVTRSDETMLAIDRVPIVFCFVEEIESTLRDNEDDVVFAALAKANTTERRGYMLDSIADEIRDGPRASKPDPFEESIKGVLRWYFDWEGKSGG